MWVVLMVAILGFLWLVRGILLPFILSFIISILLEPTVRKLRLRGWPRPLAVWAIFGTFVLATVAAMVWIVPAVTGQISGLRGKLEDVTASVTKADDNANFFVRWNPAIQNRLSAPDPIDKFLESNDAWLEKYNLPSTKGAILSQYIEPQRAQIGKSAQTFVQTFFGVATGLFLQGFMLFFVLIIAPMMMLNMDRIKQRGVLWIPPAIRPSAVSMMNDIGDVFTNYLRGVTIAVIGYFAVTTIALAICGAPYAILLGIFAGVIYLIPYLSVIISSISILLVVGFSGVTGGMVFHASSSWGFAAFILAIYLIVHVIYDSFFLPRIIGSAVGLDPIISIFVSFSGGALFGVVGMIIAYPLAGAVKIILDRIIRVTSSPGEEITLPSTPLRHRGTAT